LPQAALVVGVPCSGVNSLAALLTLAVLYAFLVCGPVTSRLVLVALSLPIALLANLLRVFLVIVLAYWVSLDAAMTYFHGWSSLALFVMALGLLVIVGKGLRCSGIRSDI